MCVPFSAARENVRAAVIQTAAKRARLSRDAQNDWGEYKLDAERKAGEVLADMPKHPGTRYGPDMLSAPEDAPPSYSELDLDYKRASRWQLLASLPDEEYEQFKESARADTEKVITQSAALAVAKHPMLGAAGRQVRQRRRLSTAHSGESTVDTHP